MSGLVAYSDSDDEDAYKKSVKNAEKFEPYPQQRGDKKLKKNKIHLPDSIQNMFSAKSNSCEDNYKHKGRTRTFAHFDGNWPTYLYIPYPSSMSTKQLYRDTVAIFQNKFGLVFFDFNDCHLSVSRTVPIRHYWIDPIFQKFKETVHKSQFFYNLSGLKVYVNDEGTRTFIGVEVSNGYCHFKDIADNVDSVFEEFGLEKYYLSPSFHVSFAWCLGNKKNEMETFIDNLPNGSMFSACNILASKLCMKTGNKTLQICFGSVKHIETGLIFS